MHTCGLCRERWWAVSLLLDKGRVVDDKYLDKYNVSYNVLLPALLDGERTKALAVFRDEHWLARLPCAQILVVRGIEAATHAEQDARIRAARAVIDLDDFALVASAVGLLGAPAALDAKIVSLVCTRARAEQASAPRRVSGATEAQLARPRWLGSVLEVSARAYTAARLPASRLPVEGRLCRALPRA